MKVIIHDLDRSYDDGIASKCDRMLTADGKYAPCQGCFGCWTRHYEGQAARGMPDHRTGR